MNCLFCNKEVKLDNEEICPDCEEGANLAHAVISAAQQWSDSIENDNTYWRRALILIENTATRIDKTLKMELQARQLDLAITNMIRSVLSFYHNDDIIAGTIVIKEVARLSILQNDGPSLWFWGTELEVACIIQQTVLSMDDDEFIGNSLGESDRGNYGFLSAIILARIQVMIRNNIERCKYKHFTDNLIDFAINLFEDQALKDYFDKLQVMGPEEKPEDLDIIDENLNRYLESRALLPQQIFSSLDDELRGLFGFTFDDVNTMASTLFLDEKEFFLPVRLFRRNVLFEKLATVLPEKTIESIVKFFSINTLIEEKDIINERKLELRSLYQTKDFVLFGKLDFLQNAGIFEKLVFSGHFIEMYLANIETPQVLRDSQQKMATLMSYKIAEMLNNAGYSVPYETLARNLGGGQIVRAEIGKIIDKTDNILNGLGDIDVLALNQQKSEILLIELKYYKPGRTIRELVMNDAGKIESKRVVEKALAREKAVMDHIGAVLQLFKSNLTGDFRVKSILVTARPNFKAVQEDFEMEYYTWNELETLIRTKNL